MEHLPEAIQASELLDEKYGVATNIWSVTSYKCLIEDVQDAEREQIRNGKEVEPISRPVSKKKWVSYCSF